MHENKLERATAVSSAGKEEQKYAEQEDAIWRMLDRIKHFFLPSLSEINPDENRPTIRVGMLALTKNGVIKKIHIKMPQIAYLSTTFC